jgi:uncharacterized membrane protein YdjX (TVP38/TMEM64 family)
VKKNYYPFIALLIFVLIYLVGRSVPPQDIQQITERLGISGPVAIFLLALLSFTFAPLSGTPVLLAGYYLYDENVIWLMNSAAVVSFVINFWIARKLGRPYIEKLIGKDSVAKIDRFTKRQGQLTLFLLRVFAGGFHDFVSYAAGLTEMKFKNYFLVSIAGALPGTFLWYFLSSQVSTVEGFLVVNFSLLGVFFVLWILINKLLKLV